MPTLGLKNITQWIQNNAQSDPNTDAPGDTLVDPTSVTGTFAAGEEHQSQAIVLADEAAEAARRQSEEVQQHLEKIIKEEEGLTAPEKETDETLVVPAHGYANSIVAGTAQKATGAVSAPGSPTLMQLFVKPAKRSGARGSATSASQDPNSKRQRTTEVQKDSSIVPSAD